MSFKEIRRFGRIRHETELPDMTQIQRGSYDRFTQALVPPAERLPIGLEGLLREIFPIKSYDENMVMEYLDYELGKPRYSPDECRQLRLTYGMPLRIRCRLTRKDNQDIMEDSVYLGELPIMLGGGEFIVNGAERVIVNQLHRSPGVDFVIESQEGDRPLHACRVIPERGSWIEINVTKKEIMVVRIDQSSKLSVTTFLRAMDERFGTTESIIREFYKTKSVAVDSLKPDMWAVGPVINKEDGEELVKAGCQIGDALRKIQQSSLKKVEVCDKVSDPIILNSLAEDPSDSHEQAVLKIYTRLRPGNPAQLEKAKTLFKEKFYDENRYRLGKVGRFRINRKFHQDISEDEMTLRPEDFLNSLKYIVQLRAGSGIVDDIDHLGNRRLRTIDELAADEIRKGFLKLRRSVQERMSIIDPQQMTRIAELINSKSIASSIDSFFGRGELSQVVDQTNPLSQLTHERRLSALGPGGLNRKRAGFEVRDVHISHYGRICPIETPEGTNIGLISSLSIYAGIDQYGFLVTPYRKVEKGKVKETVQLRADEEIEAVLSPTDVLEDDGVTLKSGQVLARVNGDLAQVDSSAVQYVDNSSQQMVGISASLIPFLEHDDANRALMGSNMQRQAVPLLATEPPMVATGMEKVVAVNSSMVIRARKSGIITYVDSKRIVIDEADEYVLRKFVGLNERTCQNQKPIVQLGQKVKKGDVIADGAATSQGELALGKNVLVGFMMYDGYNFEDAILVSEKLVKDDAFTSIHIEEFEIEIRETKLGREEFTRDIPNVSEKALANLDDGGVVRVGTYVQPGDILVGKVSPKSKSELSPEEKLLYAIFGRAGEDVKNDSLEVPSGEEGIVIDTKRFSRRMYMSEEQRKAQSQALKAYQKQMSKKIADVFRQLAQSLQDKLDIVVVDPTTKQKVGMSPVDDVILEQVETFDIAWIKPANKRADAEESVRSYMARIQELKEEQQRKTQQMKRGDELPSGVLEMVKIYIATKRHLSIGDKMAGRHGNKGVIARILPEEDMPFLEDGTSLDILLNPLGVPGRMNVGQILETHLGWAAKILGFQAITPVFDGAIEENVHTVAQEANQIISHRIEEHEETGDYPKLKEIISSFESEKDDVVCQIGFNLWLNSFKVLYTDEGGLLNPDELENLEQALLDYYPDSLVRNERHGRPRFNRDKKDYKLSSEKMNSLFLKARQKIEDSNCWIPSAREFINFLIEDRQGLYFFRNRKTGRVNEGYIGIAGKKDKQMLKERLRNHWSNHTANNFVKAFYEEALYQVNEQDKNGFYRSLSPNDIAVHMPYGGKITLYDGRTGEPFEQKVTVGCMYLMKLHHLVDDKIHARATGPYSLITQQPLGGKARTGGQRFGEMEVWGLEAYGAAYILQELLTVKSDDVEGRTKIYESMVKGTNCLEAGTPVSFDVLCNEIRGLGLNIQLEKKRIN